MKKKVWISFTIDPDIKAKLQEMARNRDVSLAHVIRLAIKWMLRPVDDDKGKSEVKQ